MAILEVMVNAVRAIVSRMEGKKRESGGDSSGGGSGSGPDVR